MKSPRFLAALAMAAVLTTGGTTAHASFQQVGGNANNGQAPMLEANIYKDVIDPNAKLDVEGDIRVDGTFTKTVNNFPTPTKDGHYLRVTMPIKMDFNYDVDNDVMTSAEAVVVNNSVHATGTTTNPSNPVLTPKKITMTIVDFKESTVGTSTVNSNVEFVNTIGQNSTSTKKVELPFKLNITGTSGNHITDYTIKNIKDNAASNTSAINSIQIAENSAVKLKLDNIAGQGIGNADLITDRTSLTSHNLKLKFEYIAN